LAIALQTLQAHRGSIDVESEIGRGTTITLRLPVTA
jgi:chemotaxis protein histidine kinase CheA